VNDDSRIMMIDITQKPDVVRVAKAEGEIHLKKETIQAIKEKEIKKGDVFTAAELAVINAVKKTSELILLAHPIQITGIKVSLDLIEKQTSLKLGVEVRSIGKTGVEIEAIMGVMTGLLTVFDMCKYLEKDERGQYLKTNISNIRVIEKTKE